MNESKKILERIKSIEERLDRIESTLGISEPLIREELKEIAEEVVDSIESENTTHESGGFTYSDVDAATVHQVLKIEYRNYKNGGRDMTFVIHPYFVKQYNNRWFAFGRNDATGDITNIALDRIMDIEPKPELKFIVNEDIDFDHFFDNPL